MQIKGETTFTGGCSQGYFINKPPVISWLITILLLGITTAWFGWAWLVGLVVGLVFGFGLATVEKERF